MPAGITYATPPLWQQFGPQHLIVLGIALLACVNLLLFRTSARRVWLDVWIVASMVVVHAAWVAWALRTGFAHGGDLLPLYTCDASIFAGLAWVLWKRRWIGQIVFYWAFLGGVVTLLLPDTFGYALPHPAPLYTLTFHIQLVLLGLEVWAGEGVRPSWGSLIPVIVATAVLVPPSLYANARWGADYMFVSRNPGGIFTFLTHYTGAARIIATLASALTVLVVGLLAWFAGDWALRRWDTRRSG
ncbi:TIGR02206 family membrane protein [Rarobacter incanus]|uniref:Putative integral membrane protein (TIGR02206 family) n=1 Tax=Rarobacter incanus TaxID=153494 RepID=A0A542SN32_9MICO|nr:TIGR02206 family membrane protein [Rarobacter incanus]TQK76012.1 putative integral membrane protein (TIGR02206 family) [Rarobacter incanus]